MREAECRCLEVRSAKREDDGVWNKTSGEEERTRRKTVEDEGGCKARNDGSTVIWLEPRINGRGAALQTTQLFFY